MPLCRKCLRHSSKNCARIREKVFWPARLDKESISTELEYSHIMPIPTLMAMLESKGVNLSLEECCELIISGRLNFFLSLPFQLSKSIKH